MKAHSKSWNYNADGCQYCLYWKGKKDGCVYSADCCCLTAQNSERLNGIDQFRAANKKASSASECKDCPYGRDSPCIGWCTKEVMRAVGLSKERDRSHV